MIPWWVALITLIIGSTIGCILLAIIVSGKGN